MSVIVYKTGKKNQENGDNKETICMHEKPSLTFHLKFKLCIAYYPLSSEACHDQGPQQSPPIRYKARTPRRLLSQLSLFLFKTVSRTTDPVELGSRKKKIKSIHSSDRRWVIWSTYLLAFKAFTIFKVLKNGLKFLYVSFFYNPLDLKVVHVWLSRILEHILFELI